MSASQLHSVDPKTTHRQYAQILGYAGAAFVPALLLLAWLTPGIADVIHRVIVIYGGAILAFLGGMQWGLSVSSGNPRVQLRRLVASMLPPLWAVVALSLPVNLCTLILLLGLSGQLIYEWLERGDGIYPSWYLPLRLQLTAALMAGLGLSLLL
jgi:hypothetical protein